MLLVLFACFLRVWAAPTSTTGPQTFPTIAHTIIWGIEPRTDESGLADRTMLMIVRSCLLTIAACVYRAIHQNIPDPKASWGRRQRIRMKITFNAILAPEAVIWWAMRQWIGAKEIAGLVNEINPQLKWTRTHGHFAQMGGLGRWDDERVLHPPTLIKLLKDGQIDIDELRRVSKSRINDHSKGDILSKGIVALQTTWFVFECLARLHQKLPLIELEVVTLAFATLNTLTYLFWWDKPLDVLCPIYLHILPTPDSRDNTSISSAPQDYFSSQLISSYHEEGRPLLSGTRIQEEVSGSVTGKALKDRRGWLTTITRPFVAAWTSVVDGIYAAVKIIRTDIRIDGWRSTVFKWLLVEPFTALGSSLTEMFGDWEVEDKATHVSTFYGYEYTEDKKWYVLSLSCFIGTIFGAIHFLSWDSPFPTHTQLLLWRISTIVLVAQPFGLVIQSLLAAIFEDDFPFISLIPASLGLIIYVLARFCVLVLAFIALRDLPPTAFETISWTTYIPHL